MVQRFFAFLLLLSVMGATTLSAAETKKPASSKPQTAQTKKVPLKTVEENYLDSLRCLELNDLGCAGVTLASINPASPYAKLLRSQMAMMGNDSETPLRLLIPLQAESGLLPQAYASLHGTLALAYEAQGNALETLEQRVRCEPFLVKAEDVADNQDRIWKLLSTQAREVLVEMRGESPDPVVQGWVDLALAIAYAEKKTRNIEQWRSAYPDHPASEALLASISENVIETITPQDAAIFQGRIAILLPLESPVYKVAAKAVLDGFMAALAADDNKPEVMTYATGDAEATRMAYRRALAEGAQYVVGPLTRDEVTAMASEPLGVPTLALNQPEGDIKPQQNLTMISLSAETEARQVARMARNHGLQTALVIAGDGQLSQRMSKAFMEEWRSLDGNISRQLLIPEVGKLAEFKLEAAAHPSDMIFLATGVAQARMVRPYLDPAIPTYGTSHVYDGVQQSVQNLDLVAVHFVDIPWMVDPENPDFSAIERSGSADSQRLFALGMDAYKLLPLLAGNPRAGKKLLDGATGEISTGGDGLLVRNLPMAQFRSDGVALEEQP